MRFTASDQTIITSLFPKDHVVGGKYIFECSYFCSDSFTLQVSENIVLKTKLLTLMEQWLETDELINLVMLYDFITKTISANISLQEGSKEEEVARQVFAKLDQKLELTPITCLEEELIYRKMIFEIFRLLPLNEANVPTSKNFHLGFPDGKRIMSTGNPIYSQKILLLRSACKLFFSTNPVLYHTGVDKFRDSKFLFDFWMYIVATSKEEKSYLNLAAGRYFESQPRVGTSSIYSEVASTTNTENKKVLGCLKVTTVEDLKNMISPSMKELLSFVTSTDEEYVKMFMTMFGMKLRSMISSLTRWGAGTDEENLKFVIESKDNPEMYFTFQFVRLQHA